MFFFSQSERHFIMQVVCEATQSPDTKVRVAALQCLVKIMSLYYQHMEHYMGPALFAVSFLFYYLEYKLFFINDITFT